MSKDKVISINEKKEGQHAYQTIPEGQYILSFEEANKIKEHLTEYQLKLFEMVINDKVGRRYEVLVKAFREQGVLITDVRVAVDVQEMLETLGDYTLSSVIKSGKILRALDEVNVNLYDDVNKAKVVLVETLIKQGCRIAESYRLAKIWEENYKR